MKITADILRAEYAAAPVAVYERTCRQWREETRGGPPWLRPPHLFNGLFYGSGVFCLPYPPAFIVVNSALPISRKFLTLIHELMHHRCYATGCQCWAAGDEVLREVHAYCGALDRLVRLRWEQGLLVLMRDLALTRHRLAPSPHRDAARAVVLQPSWQTAMAVVGDTFVRWWYASPLSMEPLRH